MIPPLILVQVTTHEMVVGELGNSRQLLAAPVSGVGTATGKWTAQALWCPERDLPFVPLELLVDRLLRIRHRRYQQLGIWVLGIVDDLLGVPPFDHVADVHHRQIFSNVARSCDIVGDVKQRHLALELHLFHQVEDPGPDRHIKHRRGLVGQDHLGTDGNVSGQVHALALAARKLVWVLGRSFFRRDQTNLFEQIVDLLFQLLLVALAHLVVDQQRAGNMVENGMGRVQRAERVLPYHLDSLAVLHQIGFFLNGGNIAPVVFNLAGCRGIHFGYHFGRGRFARAGFADDGEAAAFVHLE
ncbi:hypothetical protein H744_2c3275 [Photobacterium gaetbulicola Gung47]|uniref:Uncharacterized protein n=1 Tax=Photobacterium gaetbulicola Gung47 TaxID=658445 RepID=A0A0C5WU33_9GAMM|nr:hypothetical protein H744_2c3275 [Photobacterium gaetbulicola Gung47]